MRSNAVMMWLACGLALLQPITARAGGEDEFQERSIEIGGRAFRYRLLAPKKPAANQRYPLVLFLHGLGERGSDNRQQLRHLPESMADAALRKKYPCYLLAPQCPGDDTWIGGDWRERNAAGVDSPATAALDMARAALFATLRTEPIDAGRIYLTGLSLGGYGSWDLGVRHPEWFAAMLPVCGGGDAEHAYRLLDMPLWAWHGERDRTVPPEQSQRMIDALKQLGAKPKFTLLKGVAHDSWNDAYGKGGALDWLFDQRIAEPAMRTPGLRALSSGEAPLPPDSRIVFLGDSITAAGTATGGYVDLLKRAIAADRRCAKVEVIGAGISGNRVPDLQARLDADVLSRKPTLVFVYIGINDVWHAKQGRGTTAEDYRNGLADIVSRIQAGGARCIVATPTVIGEKPDGDNELDAQLDSYAQISREVAARAGAALCDLRQATVDYLAIINRAGRDAGVLTSDGVHLNQAGNRFVADQAARALWDLHLAH